MSNYTPDYKASRSSLQRNSYKPFHSSFVAGVQHAYWKLCVSCAHLFGQFFPNLIYLERDEINATNY